MALLHQSATYTRTFMMIQSSDHVTGLTGATVTVTLSKNGGAFAAAGGTVTEIASGLYKIALTTTDTNTLGDLAFHCTATSGDPTDFVDQVVAIDPQDGVHFGLTALPNAATGAAGGIITSGTGTAQISTTSGQVLLQTGTGTGQVNLSSGAVPVTGDLTTTMKTSVETAVWEAARSSHVTTGTMGHLGQSIIIDGTAQAGAAGTITLAAGASSTTDNFKGAIIYIYAGTGAGQAPRTINQFNGTSKVATVAPNWATAPDATSKYIIWSVDDPPFVGSDAKALISSDTHTAGVTIAGNAGNVSGSVASVTARVTANTDQWAGGTIPAPNVTGVPKVDIVDISGVNVSTSSAQLGVNAVNIGGSAAASATIGTVTNVTNAPTSGDLTATMKTSVENAVWNAAASSHTASGTFGQIVGAELVRTGTCQAGSTSTTIVFDSGASATDNWYKGTICLIISGTGSGQSRYVSSYTGSTKTATVANAWLTTPDATTVFMLMPYIYFSELVKAQMTTALTSDTITELSQAQPPVNPTISNAIMLLYMALRNQSTTTSTSFTISNDAGTVICKQTLSDDLTTFTAAKLVTGP